MKPKIQPILDMCIETGITLGYNRAYKHNDHPTQDEVKRSINKAILDEIYEWFDFADDEL